MMCVRCKLEKSVEELNKHSVYKETQRYICRPCNRERIHNSRSVSTNVSTKPKALIVDTPPNSPPVSTQDDDTDVLERTFSLTDVNFNI